MASQPNIFCISGVGGSSRRTFCLLTGCMNSMECDCSEIPPSGLERLAPYFRSPLIGQPMFASCARI